MKMMLLHLSDIHIRTDKDPILSRCEKIARSIYKYLPELNQIVILISGDIAYSGKKEEYNLAYKFLTEIKDAILAEKAINIDFVCVPGNHDNNFLLNNDTRMIVIDKLQCDESFTISENVISTCTQLQKEFFDFKLKLTNSKHIDFDPLWGRTILELNHIKISFEELNIAWVSRIEENPGTLIFPFTRYIQHLDDDIDIRITTMHHPLNWFSQGVYRPFRTFLRQVSDLIITGHEHQGNIGIIEEFESDKSIFIEGCALQSDEGPTSSSFNIIIIDLNKEEFYYRKAKYTDKLYTELEHESWDIPRRLPKKKRIIFSISEKFKEILDDLGPFSKQQDGACIRLSDVYVYPIIKKMQISDTDLNKNTSSDILLQPKSTTNGVLLEGSEKSGRTSLLYQLFLGYYDMGFAPIYMHGKDITKGTPEELEQIIKKQFTTHYGKDHFIQFQQLPKERKIILLDNFEDSTLKTGHLRAGFICLLKERFGHTVVTIDDLFEVREMTEDAEFKELASLTHYQIQAFGYTGRAQLISKWVSLDKSIILDESKFIAKCDQVERLTDAIMIKSIIPSVPLHLLTLLQSIDYNRSAEFQDSALGYYYLFLLTGAFQQAGVKPEKLTEIFQYSAHLAWEYHRLDKDILSTEELLEFNKNFSENWHTVEFAPRIQLLVDSKLLRQDGDSYEFRYPYMYYFLKGQYISEQIDAPGMRDYISHCCAHLYVRDHANTILFLVHHINHISDDFVLKTIELSLHNIFESRKPINLLKDIGATVDLIKEGPDLTYTGESPIVHRKRKNEIKDNAEPQNDGLADKEENGAPSLLSQIIMVFKTGEILSHVLKNQYSRIKRTRKTELIRELFDAPLRALDDFYNWIGSNPTQIVNAIDKEIQKRKKAKNPEEAREIAKKYVGSLIQFVTLSFIHKTAQAINSENLSEDIQSVVSSSENFSLKLIDLSIRLDSPKPLPRTQIEAIIEEAKGDILVNRLLRLLIIQRLYMFSTSRSDKTWLDKKKIITMKSQNSLIFQENTQRLVNS